MTTNTQSAAVRRKFADALEKLSQDRRIPKKDRAELARMADAWRRTLPEKKSSN